MNNYPPGLDERIFDDPISNDWEETDEEMQEIDGDTDIEDINNDEL